MHRNKDRNNTHNVLLTMMIFLSNKAKKEYACEIIKKTPEGWVVDIKKPTRSLEQNAKMWALLHELSNARPEGRLWTPETWKCAFMHALGFTMRFEEGIDGTGPFPTEYRSSKMNKEQMSLLIEYIYSYAARHGVIFNEDSTSANNSKERQGQEKP